MNYSDFLASKAIRAKERGAFQRAKTGWASISVSEDMR